MSAHLIADPDATCTAVFPTRPEWLDLSAALAEEVPMIADRDDLLVRIAPGAGGGAPACFFPAEAVIEIDGTHLGVSPSTVYPSRLSDRARYSTMWGLLVHECGHAKHSLWDLPDDTPPAIAEAAMLLEETRMEAAHVRRRPDDQHWLRASATSLILADEAVHTPGMTKADAARTAALVLARVDSGILNIAEAAPVALVIEEILGADTLAALRTLWQEALSAADDDAATMINVAERWCDVIGIDVHTPTPADGKPVDPCADEPATPSLLADAIKRAAADLAASVAAENTRILDTTTGYTSIKRTRPPTADERAAARLLGRALSTAGVRERVAVRSMHSMPPGRLNMRGVIAAAAQRDAGAAPIAEPFTRISRQFVPAPPLRLGIACDVSSSMSDVRRPVASAAWILAHAGRHSTVPTDTATVIFGVHVRPITRPGTIPTQVTEFDSRDYDEDVTGAIDALDEALGLSRHGAARLLVVVSDGDFTDDQRRDGQQRINRLRASGCAVLWLTSSDSDTPFSGVTVHQLTDPATTALAIGRAATQALRTIR